MLGVQAGMAVTLAQQLQQAWLVLDLWRVKVPGLGQVQRASRLLVMLWVEVALLVGALAPLPWLRLVGVEP